jgi:hypothetical protein
VTSSLLLSAPCSLLFAHRSLQSAPRSLLSAIRSLLSAICSLLTAICSFAVRCSLFAVRCSLFAARYFLRFSRERRVNVSARNSERNSAGEWDSKLGRRICERLASHAHTFTQPAHATPDAQHTYQLSSTTTGSWTPSVPSSVAIMISIDGYEGGGCYAREENWAEQRLYPLRNEARIFALARIDVPFRAPSAVRKQDRA